MEINRDIYRRLIEWKNNCQGKRALLIEGARRIGKSTLVKEFGEKEYRSCILIDFNIAPKAVLENFSENLNHLDIFYQVLSLEYNTRLYPRESLIIFDEVQKYPKAREAVKYLVADGRYDIIETGSLISIHENVRNITVPSEERKLKMYPVTFREFASFAGEDILLEYIHDCREKQMPLSDNFHRKAMRLFSEYMLVGGMPQAVTAYFHHNRDFHAADVEKRDILDLYRDDIRKAAGRYHSRVSALFETIPAALSTHEKKIVLSKIDSSSNPVFDAYDEPLFWLDDSMICNLCYKCNDPNAGFALNLNDSQVKCYMGDTGLLVSLAFSENEISSQQLYKAILNGKLNLNRGMLYENMIAQMIRASGKKLYFYNHYAPELHRNDMEIDFLLSNESHTGFKIFPIEVKSSKNYTTVSLNRFQEKFSAKIGQSLIIHPKNFSQTGGILAIPPYMVDFAFSEKK